MSRLLYVPLPEPARTALRELAEREWRDPRDQAALLVVDGLRRAGVLGARESPASLDPVAQPDPAEAAS